MGYGENRELNVSPHHPKSGHIDDPLNSQYSRDLAAGSLRAPARRVDPDISLADILASISEEKVQENFKRSAQVLAEARSSIARVLSMPGAPEHDSAEVERAARELSQLASQLADDTESLSVRFSYAAARLEALRSGARAEVARQTSEVQGDLQALKAKRDRLARNNEEMEEALRLKASELAGLKKAFENEMKMHEARVAALPKAEG